MVHNGRAPLRILVISALAGPFPSLVPAAPPEAPILMSPADGAVVQTLWPAFWWRKAAGATDYTLQVAEDSSFSLNAVTLATDNDTSDSYPITNAVLHFWRVRSTNADGDGPWSEPRRFSIAPPGIAAPVSPIDGKRYQPETPRLLWTRLAVAATYRLEVAADSGMTRILYAHADLKDYVLTIGRLDFGTYYWRTQAENAAGTGPWSPVSSFIVSLPEPPVLSWPPRDTMGISPSTALSWYRTLGADRGYDVQVSEDSTFSTRAYSGSAHEDEREIFMGVIAHLQPGKRYYWRAGATNSRVAIAWSKPWSFSTLPAPGHAPRLLARWDFEEGAGLRILDQSGNGDHGEFLGDPVRGGVGGTALHFDGESGIQIPFAPQFRLDRFTLTTWVNLDSGTYEQCLVCREENSSSMWNFKLSLTGKSNLHGARQHTPVISYASYPGTSPTQALRPYVVALEKRSVIADTQLRPGTWHHVAASFENRRLRIYLDGKLRGDKDSLPSEPYWWDDSGRVFLGGAGRAPFMVSAFQGWMDETRIYSYALSDAQIDSIYRSFTPARVPEIPLATRVRNRLRLHLDGTGHPALRITGLASPAHVELRDLSGRQLAEWVAVRNGQALHFAGTRRLGLLLVRVTESGETRAFKLPVLAF